MKVFLVWFYDYDSCSLVGVYSTLEKAKEVLKEDEDSDKYLEIEEREVW
jgi:hypothetical protein